MAFCRSFIALLLLASLSFAQTPLPTDLVGTWSTKSNKTLTGPGFYDPLNDELIEPSHTGISYSFTQDGFYESAYYRAIANPTNPRCPEGIMQWQHGSWTVLPNNSVLLTPIAVDGRQLQSAPCKYSTGIYTRYNQTEIFKWYAAYTDPYHNIPRLDMYKFDGSPMNAMYLAFRPPQMLPTTTLNPVKAQATASGKSKRGLDTQVPLQWLQEQGSVEFVQYVDADRLWWLGLAMTGLGGLMYFGPRRLGIRR